MRFPIEPLTREQLVALANPSSAALPEALPYVLYDTLTYTDNSTVRLNFFQQVTTNDLTNMEIAGSLADPQFFRIYSIGMDILRDATTGAGVPAGAIDDVHKLALTARAYWTFTMSQKRYGPIPLSFLHASGGATGMSAGTFAATTNIEFANNGVFDGGYWVGGSLVIPPKIAFNLEVNWPAAVDLTADVKIRVWLAGVLFRRVL